MVEGIVGMNGMVVAVVGAAGIVALGACAGEDAGGAGEVVQLGEVEAVYDEAFSVVSTVREMPDGRAVVADPLSQVLLLIDLDAGAADTLGGVGEGPREYRQPDAVWPLPEGKTLLVDLGNGRLTELGPDLVFGETRPYAVGDPMAGTMVVAVPLGVDGQGSIYFRGLGSMGEMADSTTILRMDLESGAIDSVGTFKVPGTTRTVTGGANNQNVRISPIPLSLEDAWGVAADGRVVIARAGDYHVDWIARDGSTTSGPPVAYTPVSIGRAEREEWRESQSETGGGLGIRATSVNGAVSVIASRGGGLDDDGDLDGYDWPKVMPPFYGRPVPVDQLGRAWVRRHRKAGSAPRYDVFDGSGEVVMTVDLPMGRRVVSFGDGRLYAVRMDEFGLQYLERYALP